GREQPTEYKTLLGRPVSSLPAASDLGWSTPLTDFDLLAVAWWMLIVTLLGAIALPLSIRVFPAFPDHGFGFARLLGLVCTGYLAWIFVTLDLMPFTMPWLLLPLALMIIAVAWIACLHQLELVALLRRHGPFILVSEAAFWAAFCVFLGFRLLDPDLWHPIFGGEKPMELAYINAIAR
ncbi:MAG: hypothetical protein C4345_11320, partial [Chloroflexota bacterium]